MSKLRTHDACKYFGYKKCPHLKDEIMKQATQNLPEYHGGKPVIMSFPTGEEIDEICCNCGTFSKK